MTKITNDQNNLYNKAVEIIEGGRKKIVESIYNESTKSYFLLGKLIVEEEQAGENRAEYGKEVIKNLSKKLTLKYGRGFSVSTLKDCRKFYQKSQTLSVQSDFKLPFGHYTYLIRFSDEEMKFYEQHAIKENLSLRKLKKAVETNTMLRLLKDGDKSKVEDKKDDSNSIANKSRPALTPREIVKDPYILDFLGLDKIKEGQESLLESKLIEHLEKFLLELGRGFAFVGRQYRLTLSEDSFYADLVFYNIPLKCYVVFELKTRKMEHKDLGQLQMYVNYFDREIRDENDNKTIGILLCSDKNDKVVKYTLPEENQTIFTSKFKLYLPSKEELEGLLKDQSEAGGQKYNNPIPSKTKKWDNLPN